MNLSWIWLTWLFYDRLSVRYAWLAGEYNRSKVEYIIGMEMDMIGSTSYMLGWSWSYDRSSALV